MYVIKIASQIEGSRKWFLTNIKENYKKEEKLNILKLPRIKIEKLDKNNLI